MPYSFNDDFNENGSYDYGYDAGTGYSVKDVSEEEKNKAFSEALGLVRREMINRYSTAELSNGGPVVTEEARKTARRIYSDYNTQMGNRGGIPIQMSRDDFVSHVVAELFGMGVITPLLADMPIEDIAVNGPKEVVVFREGHWEYLPGYQFESAERALEMINRGISAGNKKANQVIPIADGVLPGKERVSVVTYPVTDTWPVIVIRCHRSKDITLTDFTKKYKSNRSVEEEERLNKAKFLVDYTKSDTGGMLTAKAAYYLHAAVLTGLNIVLVGPTGCGKTTMLTALGKCIPEWNRILIIEDTPEIDLYPGSDAPHNVIYLRTRAASVDGNLPAVKQSDLVKLALRQRPDALTLGEARGEEVFDLLNALNTGHKNGLTSLHAEGEKEVFGRIYMMLAQSEQGRHLDRFRAANLAANTMNILVTLQVHGNNRYVKSIAEYSGRIANADVSPEPEIVPIFENVGGPTGHLSEMLSDSCFIEKFSAAGMPRYTYTTDPLPQTAEF